LLAKLLEEILRQELYIIRPGVYEQTLRGCDVLEGIPAGQLSGEFYRRQKVTVETTEGPCEAWAYCDAGTT
jgi:gamma-glutamylcyclotransferase (GGCT)/AIG2-like uncharacterized protein YtfP